MMREAINVGIHTIRMTIKEFEASICQVYIAIAEGRFPATMAGSAHSHFTQAFARPHSDSSTHPFTSSSGPTRAYKIVTEVVRVTPHPHTHHSTH